LNKDPRRGPYRVKLNNPAERLRERNAAKVTIDLLGTVRRADRRKLIDAAHR